jgi:non-homologous end joining protein Ku
VGALQKSQEYHESATANIYTRTLYSHIPSKYHQEEKAENKKMKQNTEAKDLFSALYRAADIKNPATPPTTRQTQKL